MNSKNRQIERSIIMNIVIVDDDCLVSLSLKTILESNEGFHVLAIGSNGKEAITLYETHQPDVLLMDIRMETMTGLEAAKVILSKHADAKILFLTTFSDQDYIIEALSVGVKGYLLKQDFESIAPSLEAVYRGQSVFGGEIVSKLPNLMQSSSNFDYSAYDVTEREVRIIELVAKGLSNKEIAEQLFLGEGTIRNYLSSILDKLRLRDRTQLAIFYYQHK